MTSYSWCGDDSGNGRLITSCNFYILFCIPSILYSLFFLTAYHIPQQYIPFSYLDGKTNIILFLFQLLCAICFLLSCIMFWSSDQTSLVLLITSVFQALAWVLCIMLTTRETWRITHWPSNKTSIYIAAATFVAFLQVVSINSTAELYSHNMVKCGTAQFVVILLLDILVAFKSYVYTPEETERLELDRASVDVYDGNQSYSGDESFTGNPILGAALFRRLIGGGSSNRGQNTRSGSGVSLKNWFSRGSNDDTTADDDGYAVVGDNDYDDESWERSNFSNQGQSAVLSALEKHSLSDYSPPRNSNVDPDAIDNNKEEWVMLSGDKSDFLYDKPKSTTISTVKNTKPVNQSQAVKRALQQQNARIAAAGSVSSFGSSTLSYRNKTKSPNPSSSVSNMIPNTDYYSITATKWGSRHQEHDDNDDHLADNDEIEFEIQIKVKRANESSENIGDWHESQSAESNKFNLQRANWSVYRTGAEIMSLHSQIVIAHGEACAPRRPKLKSMQPKAIQLASITRPMGRSKSTDRVPSPLQLLALEKETQSVSEADTSTEKGLNHNDLAIDLRTISVYLMALLTISNGQNDQRSSVTASGSGSVGIPIPIGGLRHIYPALLNFLEIFIGGKYEEGNRNSDNFPSSETTLDSSVTERSSLSRRNSAVDAAFPTNEGELEPEGDEDMIKWRKIFMKLKSNVILQNQCVRCRLFRECVRGTDIYNFLQVINDNFLKEEEALEIGKKLIQCGLLRPVVLGHNGLSWLQIGMIGKNSQSEKDSQSLIDDVSDYFNTTDVEASAVVDGVGASDASAALLFANDPQYLYSFTNAHLGENPGAQPIFQISDNPSDRFILLGGLGIEAAITDTDNNDGSVRYCLSLKHVSPQVVEVDRKFNGSGSDRWLCWRRYSDFDKLHNQLCNLSMEPPASLPPKTISIASVASAAALPFNAVSSGASAVGNAVGLLKSSTETFKPIDARREGLQTYLISVIDHVMNGDEDRESSVSARDKDSISMGGLASLDILTSINSSNKGFARSEAKVVLARFLDAEHDKLTIR
jgi:hypothetical protein